MYRSLNHSKKLWCLIENYTLELTIILTALIYHSSKTIFITRQTPQMVKGVCLQGISLMSLQNKLQKGEKLISLYAEATFDFKLYP